mgnify:CR=1 FL=1
MVSFALVGCQNDPSPKIETQPSKRPNILLILADDMGYSDIGAFGGEISTPNIDQLAAGGVRMSNLYAAATCSPTRSMILSGVDNHRAGMGTMANNQTAKQLGKPGYEGYMNYNVVSVAALLQDAGYHTYMTGKWHLGNTEQLSPKARGFDQSFALLQGGAGHFDDTTMFSAFDKAWFRENGKRADLPDHFFSSEFYTDKMIDYIKTNQNDDQPFFGYLAYTAPHWPLQAPQDYIDKYRGKYDDGYNALKEKRLLAMQELGLVKPDVKIIPSYTPETADWNGLSEQDKKNKSREMEIYAAMVDNMDYHIGRLLDYLEKSGQRDNTLIIFMSDNGAAGADNGKNKAFPQQWIDANFDNSYDNLGKIGSYVYYGPHWAEASAAPSRLFKGFSTEGGLKVPGIINFPGKLEKYKGQINNQFMTILDLAPTFLDLAKTKHPGTNYKGRKVIPYTGKSAAAFLNGTSDTVHGDQYTMAWELRKRASVRKNDWKMLKMPKPHGSGDWQLYNLKDDPGEVTDIKIENPEIFQEMLKAWDDYVIENGVIMAEE